MHSANPKGLRSILGGFFSHPSSGSPALYIIYYYIYIYIYIIYNILYIIYIYFISYIFMCFHVFSGVVMCFHVFSCVSVTVVGVLKHRLKLNEVKRPL